MNRTRLWSLLLIPLAVFMMGAAVLVDPPPISVPAGLATKDVSKAIRSGIVGRGWVVTKDENGHMATVLNVRTHEVKVDIGYDTKQVTIKYVDSTNLDYDDKKGVRHIHKKYNQWIDNMVKDIQAQLQVAKISKE
jgi:hypothetical protein